MKRIFELSLTEPQLNMPPRCPCAAKEPVSLRSVEPLFDDGFKRAWNQEFANFFETPYRATRWAARATTAYNGSIECPGDILPYEEGDLVIILQVPIYFFGVADGYNLWCLAKRLGPRLPKVVGWIPWFQFQVAET